jgi:hypothetical protein
MTNKCTVGSENVSDTTTFNFSKWTTNCGWLERILTMVYVVQIYLAFFGLYPSYGMWKFYKRPRFGDWICLRPQVDGVA